ncbi:MAG: HAMP domain-containing histidine kinase [Solirubrobacterales bacterium]|nr:HAMP domain-containing histidine kinase [Solirubrobacterales bacterium]
MKYLLGLGVVAGALVLSYLELGGAHTLIIALALLGIALVAAAGSELLLRRPLSLSDQLAVTIALVLAPLLIALAIFCVLMFVSNKDAILVGVIALLSGVAGVAVATRLAGALNRDVARIRDGLLAVGAGERELELEVSSATELRQLCEATVAMQTLLLREEAARDQAESARRHLVAAASHDLRTPITSLQLLAEAIDDEVVDGPLRRDYVRRMLTHIHALSALIDDLFELARLEAGDITWTLEQVSVDQLLAETVDAMQADAEHKGVAVRTQLPGGSCHARANPEKLQRVLFNLIQNAIRHSPADGTVVVRAERLSEMIEVEVADSGSGISAADRERVFETFYRGSGDEARNSDGAGLGLSVARAIIDAHGGRIWLPDSEVGTRVRFSVRAAG